MSQKTPENRSGEFFQSNRPAGLDSRWTILGICLLLAAVTLAVFGPTLRYGFVNYDDDAYVYENPAVAGGLTFKGIVQAFVHGSAENWDPLTTISHMLDCQLYGLKASGHHMTNVLLHAATVILLFWVLRQMTGTLWRSAFVAAVFAIHPLRAESVAWVTERKDVLSGLFFMLTLWAYVHYVRKPPSRGRYLTVMLCFALGLMSKAMLVTLPLILLLLDYWPLNRFSQPAAAGSKNLFIPLRLILEKIPLLALSLASCVAALLAQGHAVQTLEKFPVALRMGNALVSYVAYAWQTFYPAGLAVFYPYPANGLPLWEVVLALLVLLAVSLAVFLWRQKRPYLLVGWLWYLGMLLPVIGLVQIGTQARADRYTYLPQVGLCLAVVWTAGSLGAGWRHRRPVFGGVAAIVLAALGVSSFVQISYWRDSESLWRHTLDCTSGNALAQYDLGMTLLQKGQADEAMTHFQEAVEISPQHARAHVSLGVVLLQKGRVDEAITHFQKALQLEIHPDHAGVHYNLGVALLQKGRVDEAIVHLQRALEIHPDYADACHAVTRVVWVLATSPDASVRNGVKAVASAEQAVRLSGGKDPLLVGTLAAAYAEVGRFPEAVAAAGRAQQLAAQQGNAPLADFLGTQIKLYQAGTPFRDTSMQVAPTPLVPP